MCRDVSRYYLSPGFEKDIASWTDINEAWQTNKPEGTPFLPEEMKETFDSLFVSQLSLHGLTGTPPEKNTVPGMKIIKKTCEKRYNNDHEEMTLVDVLVDVSVVICLEIIDLDLAFYYTEFVPTSSSSSVRKPDVVDDGPDFRVTFTGKVGETFDSIFERPVLTENCTCFSGCSQRR